MKRNWHGSRDPKADGRGLELFWQITSAAFPAYLPVRTYLLKLFYRGKSYCDIDFILYVI